ncbi:hypothetical protein RSOLAG1IB_06160 [Rhizoctonia solani AG-1 IB]|uniref:F-box-like domain-containing protein n=1 Tax=Thanatephorus cucumeris (strain AG1-IB / isolate 7/3/14) TaxID=1108050 RepID=A0A0B7F6N7_THACB|nr:hypothetical protein RSOLAG1IB_06160 [Rhizoctonia solani AG-1 IB]
MIEDSRELDDLQLKLAATAMGADDLDKPWRPSDLFLRLRNPLAYIRRLSIGGSYKIDWETFIDTSPPCVLRRFFEQRPDIHTVGFEWNDNPQPDLAFAPSLLEHMFPSLEYFTGPMSMCEGIMSSRLANQLKEIKILYEGADPSGPRVHTFDTLASAIKPLPRLEALQISCMDPERLL